MSAAEGFDLVTGGSGFLGAHLVRVLRHQGERVRVLDPAAPQAGAEPHELLQGSVTDPAAVDRAVAGAKRVFHIAGLAGLWARDKDEHLRVNHRGTRTVLDAAAAHGVGTVVHCSTAMILTRSLRPDGRYADEDARPDPSEIPGSYCRSKLLAEEAAFDAARAGQRVVVVSPTALLGPRDLGLTPPARMLLGFLNGELPAYLDALLNYIDVRDAAAAHVAAADRGCSGRRYVLSGTHIHISEVLNLLSGLSGAAVPRRRIPYWLAYLSAFLAETYADYVTGRPPVASLPGVQLVRDEVRFAGWRARSELGMTVRPLTDTLADTIADFANRGLIRPRLQQFTRADT